MPRQPRRALDLSARIRQPELVSVELEPFGPGSESRWRAEASGALTAAGRDGLLVRGAVILHPASPAPALPAGARRIALHLTGGRARVELRLRNSSGMEQTVRMMPPLGANSPLAAPLPEGAWSLSTMTVAPEDDAEIRLSALIAEAIPAPGAYATAWKQGELLLVRIYNLGETTEHVALESAPAATLAEADLAPRGQAYVRVPVAGFPGSVHPPVLWLVRSGGRVAVPVE